MTDMSMGFTLTNGLRLSHHELEHLEALVWLPGEQVTLVDGASSPGLAGYELVVAQVLVSPCTIVDDALPWGLPVSLSYVFQGHEGSHDAQMFTDARGKLMVAGTLLRRDNQAWLVPGIASHAQSRLDSSDTLMISGCLERMARAGFRVSDEEGEDEFWQNLDLNPSIGEFVLHPAPDGSWVLGTPVWTNYATAKEAALAVSRLPSPSAPELSAAHTTSFPA